MANVTVSADYRYRPSSLLAGAGLLIFYLLLCLTKEANSDEAQHVHVVWGWTQGLWQFCDVFDNHAPLFHILYAPLLKLLLAVFPESPAILQLLRVTILSLGAVCLWGSYRLTTELFGRRDALWAAVLLATCPEMLKLATEFRTDNLWAAVWVVFVVVMVTQRLSDAAVFFTRRRLLLGGLLFGAAFSVSLKSVLLGASGALAATTVWFLLPRAGRQFADGRFVRRLLYFGLASLTVPLIIVAAYAYHQGLRELYYGVIAHNNLAGLDHGNRFGVRGLIVLLSFPLFAVAARQLIRRSADRRLGLRRAFVFLSAVTYLTAAISLWPIMTDQNLLPFMPLIFVVAAPALRWGVGKLARGGDAENVECRVLVFIAALQVVVALGVWPPWQYRFGKFARETALILRLTQRADFVMDAKGDAMFRRRPFYYALETVTLERIARGLIVDDIPERLAATGTGVIKSGPYSARTWAFINANYLAVSGSVHVAGQELRRGADQRSFVFRVAVPAQYQFSSDGVAMTGVLDGRATSGEEFLAAGEHEFVTASDVDALTMRWVTRR